MDKHIRHRKNDASPLLSAALGGDDGSKGGGSGALRNRFSTRIDNSDVGMEALSRPSAPEEAKQQTQQQQQQQVEAPQRNEAIAIRVKGMRERQRLLNELLLDNKKVSEVKDEVALLFRDIALPKGGYKALLNVDFAAVGKNFDKVLDKLGDQIRRGAEAIPEEPLRKEWLDLAMANLNKLKVGSMRYHAALWMQDQLVNPEAKAARFKKYRAYLERKYGREAASGYVCEDMTALRKAAIDTGLHARTALVSKPSRDLIATLELLPALANAPLSELTEVEKIALGVKDETPGVRVPSEEERRKYLSMIEKRRAKQVFESDFGFMDAYLLPDNLSVDDLSETELTLVTANIIANVAVEFVLRGDALLTLKSAARSPPPPSMASVPVPSQGKNKTKKERNKEDVQKAGGAAIDAASGFVMTGIDDETAGYYSLLRERLNSLKDPSKSSDDRRVLEALEARFERAFDNGDGKFKFERANAVFEAMRSVNKNTAAEVINEAMEMIDEQHRTGRMSKEKSAERSAEVTRTALRMLGAMFTDGVRMHLPDVVDKAESVRESVVEHLQAYHQVRIENIIEALCPGNSQAKEEFDFFERNDEEAEEDDSDQERSDAKKKFLMDLFIQKSASTETLALITEEYDEEYFDADDNEEDLDSDDDSDDSDFVDAEEAEFPAVQASSGYGRTRSSSTRRPRSKSNNAPDRRETQPNITLSGVEVAYFVITAVATTVTFLTHNFESAAFATAGAIMSLDSKLEEARGDLLNSFASLNKLYDRQLVLKKELDQALAAIINASDTEKNRGINLLNDLINEYNNLYQDRKDLEELVQTAVKQSKLLGESLREIEIIRDAINNATNGQLNNLLPEGPSPFLDNNSTGIVLQATNKLIDSALKNAVENSDTNLRDPDFGENYRRMAAVKLLSENPDLGLYLDKQNAAKIANEISGKIDAVNRSLPLNMAGALQAIVNDPSSSPETLAVVVSVAQGLNKSGDRLPDLGHDQIKALVTDWRDLLDPAKSDRSRYPNLNDRDYLLYKSLSAMYAYFNSALRSGGYGDIAKDVNKLALKYNLTNETVIALANHKEVFNETVSGFERMHERLIELETEKIDSIKTVLDAFTNTTITNTLRAYLDIAIQGQHSAEKLIEMSCEKMVEEMASIRKKTLMDSADMLFKRKLASGPFDPAFEEADRITLAESAIDAVTRKDFSESLPNCTAILNAARISKNLAANVVDAGQQGTLAPDLFAANKTRNISVDYQPEAPGIISKSWHLFIANPFTSVKEWWNSKSPNEAPTPTQYQEFVDWTPAKKLPEFLDECRKGLFFIGNAEDHRVWVPRSLGKVLQDKFGVDPQSRASMEAFYQSVAEDSAKARAVETVVNQHLTCSIALETMSEIDPRNKPDSGTAGSSIGQAAQRLQNLTAVSSNAFFVLKTSWSLLNYYSKLKLIVSVFERMAGVGYDFLLKKLFANEETKSELADRYRDFAEDFDAMRPSVSQSIGVKTRANQRLSKYREHDASFWSNMRQHSGLVWLIYLLKKLRNIFKKINAGLGQLPTILLLPISLLYKEFKVVNASGGDARHGDSAMASASERRSDNESELASSNTGSYLTTALNYLQRIVPYGISTAGFFAFGYGGVSAIQAFLSAHPYLAWGLPLGAVFSPFAAARLAQISVWQVLTIVQGGFWNIIETLKTDVLNSLWKFSRSTFLVGGYILGGCALVYLNWQAFATFSYEVLWTVVGSFVCHFSSRFLLSWFLRTYILKWTAIDKDDYPNEIYNKKRNRAYLEGAIASSTVLAEFVLLFFWNILSPKNAEKGSKSTIDSVNKTVGEVNRSIEGLSNFLSINTTLNAANSSVVQAVAKIWAEALKQRLGNTTAITDMANALVNALRNLTNSANM